MYLYMNENGDVRICVRICVVYARAFACVDVCMQTRACKCVCDAAQIKRKSGNFATISSIA